MAHDPNRVHSTALSNAFVERFIRSIKEECVERVIPLGEAHLRELLFRVWAVQSSSRTATTWGGIVRRERLGGMLNSYHREAA